MRRFHLLRGIAAILLASAASFTATTQAQSAAVLGKNDAAYATQLYRAGYPELAERLLKAIETSGAVEPNEQIGVKALALDIRTDLALRETEAEKRKTALAQVLAEKEDFARNYEGKIAADDTIQTLPDVYQKLGEAITSLLQKETDPAKIEQYRKEGHEIFSKAELKLQERLEKIEQQINDAWLALGDAAGEEDAKIDPALEQQKIRTLYNLPRTFYYHSQIFPKDDFKKTELIDKAIEGFNAFGLDYSDLLWAYEGLIFLGLCEKEKGNQQEALSAFDDAIRMREQFVQDAKGYFQIGQSEGDLVAAAVLQKIIAQRDFKDYAGAAATMKDFVDTIPGAYETRSGLACLAALAEAHVAAGDVKSAGDAADKLVELDPRGPWGAKGRELQGKMLGGGGASMDAEKVLSIARTYLDRGDDARALEIAAQAVAALRGHPKEAQLGVDAWLFIGAIHKKNGALQEASVAFDAAAERYGAEPKCAEAVFQAMDCYRLLNKSSKRKFYTERLEQRRSTLASKYATHPRAASAQLAEAQGMQDDGQYAEAAAEYAKIPPTSQVYLDATVAGAQCHLLRGRDLAKAGKAAEAKLAYGTAEDLFKKARNEAEVQRGKTLNLDDKARFESLALRAMVGLAQIYLSPETARAADVLPLLQGADETYASNSEAINNFWRFRIEALRAQGKLDDAVAQLEALIKTNPESKAIAPAAAIVGSALDTRAAELRDKEKKPRDADEMQKKAARYYAVAGRGFLKSDNPKVSEIEPIAKRLFALGLESNAVPEDQLSFVGWDPKKNTETQQWALAAELYEATLRLVPGYQMQVQLGRCYGYLGEYAKAAGVLGGLFETEQVYDPEKKQLKRAVIRQKQELFFAYLELGLAEHEAAIAANDQDGFRRASTIFAVMARELTATSRDWWYTKYYQIRNLSASGSYSDAKIQLNDLERTTSGYGEQHGLKDRFLALKRELDSK